MSLPRAFTKEYIAQASLKEEQLYTSFLESGEPYRSINQPNAHQSARKGYSVDAHDGDRLETPGLDLEDQTLYYNTQGEAQSYWSDFDLPKPTQAIRQLREDLRRWGYCLIDEALSAAQLERMQKRLAEQAEAERLAGIASWMGTPVVPGDDIPNTQFLHALINKGQQFIQCVEHDPQGVQAGLVMEQLLNEVIGPNFLMSSFIGIITRGLNIPQALHQDQGTAPFQDPVAPYTCNTMYIMDDMGVENGGTLVVPGSHRLLSVRSGEPVTESLPPAINVTAKAGTVMMFEGRLLHGTGVNRTDRPRTALVMNSVKPFMRQQELHMMSARSDILTNASDKLLYRLGARPTGLGGIEGAWNGDYLVNQRLMLERGDYKPVGELSPNMDLELLSAPFSYRFSDAGMKQRDYQPETLPEVREQTESLSQEWQRPRGPRFPNKA